MTMMHPSSSRTLGVLEVNDLTIILEHVGLLNARDVGHTQLL